MQLTFLSQHKINVEMNNEDYEPGKNFHTIILSILTQVADHLNKLTTN